MKQAPKTSGRKVWVEHSITFNVTTTQKDMAEELLIKARENDPTITRTRVMQDALTYAHKNKIYG